MPEDLAPCGIETKPTEKELTSTENKSGLPEAGGGGGETGEGTSFQMYNQQAWAATHGMGTTVTTTLFHVCGC